MRILQVQISGMDVGGYVWQNVLHVKTDNDAASEFDILNHMNSWIVDNLLVPYQDSMNDTNKILNVSSKIVVPAGGYTLNHAVLMPGTRPVDPMPGACAGRISWLPDTGGALGRTFIAGPGTDDYVEDQVSSGYAGLLGDIATAILTMDTTPVTDHWQFGVFNRKTNAFVDVTHFAVLARIGILGKRVRA